MKKGFLLGLFGVLLIGCTYPDNSKGFIIEDIKPYRDSKTKCRYHITSFNQETSDVVNTWFVDYCDKWNVNDTLHFSK